MKNANDTDLYYFVVELHGQVILDGRLPPGQSGRHLCWSEDCSDCVPYVKLPETPAGDDPYTSYDLYSGDSSYLEDDYIAGESTYWPTLQDLMDGTNGVPGTVAVNDADRTVRFTYP